MAAAAAASGAMKDRDDVARFLLAHRYVLTALEFQQELLDEGYECAELKAYFSNESNFPPAPRDDIWSGPAVDPDQKSSLLEYELRLAKEDIESLKERLRESQSKLHSTAAAAAAVAAAAATGPAPSDRTAAPGSLVSSAAPASLAPSDTASVSGTVIGLRGGVPHDGAPITEDERRILNALVRRYLVENKFKMTAVTFADEIGDDEADELPVQALLDLLRIPASAVTERQSVAELQEALDRARAEKKAMEERVRALSSATQQLQQYTEKIKSKKRNLKREMKDLRQMLDEMKRRLEAQATGRGPKADPAPLPPVTPAPTAPATAGPPKEREASSRDTGALKSRSDSVAVAVAAAVAAASAPVVVPPASPAPPVGSRKGPSSVQGTGEAAPSPPAVPVTLTEEGERVVRTVAETLPRVVPHVLLNNREELLPMFQAAIRAHPSREAREQLLHLLLNLVKRPAPAQAQTLVEGYTRVARDMGPERVEEELFPQLMQQIQHKDAERRSLAGRTAAAVVSVARPRARASLVLPVLSHLLDDPLPANRVLCAESLGAVLKTFPDGKPFDDAHQMLFHLLFDPEAAVHDAALAAVLGPLAEYAAAHKLMWSGYAEALLGGIAGLARMPQLVPDSDEARQLSVLCATTAQAAPVLFRALFADGPLKGTPPEAARAKLDEYLERASDLDKWPALFWLANKGVPELLSAAASLDTVLQDSRRQLLVAIRTLCQTFGPVFSDVVVMAGLLTALRHEEENDAGDVSERRGRLLAVYAGAIVGGLRPDRAMRVARELIIAVAMQESGWTSAHASILEDGLRMTSYARLKDPSLQEPLLLLLTELGGNPSSSVRGETVRLLETLTETVEASRIARFIVPAITTLSSDPDRSVRMRCVDAVGAIVANTSDPEILKKMQAILESFLDERNFDMSLAVLMTFAHILPTCAASFREDYAVPKLFHLTLANHAADTATRAERSDMAKVLLEAYRACTASNLSQAAIVKYVLPGLQTLGKDAPRLLDSTYSALVQSMVRDFSTKVPSALAKEALSGHVPSDAAIAAAGAGPARSTATPAAVPTPTAGTPAAGPTVTAPAAGAPGTGAAGSKKFDLPTFNFTLPTLFKREGDQPKKP